MARLGRSQPVPFHRATKAARGEASVVVTGTIIGASETDIVAGGKTIILTVTGDIWVNGANFNASRSGILSGLDSAGAEGTGWDAVVKVGAAITDVVRTSDTVVTITLEAFATYNITANETITVTVPPTALEGGAQAIATPTFTILASGAAVIMPPYLFDIMAA